VDVDDLDPRQRAYRHDATLWVWIFYGLAQATITMLMAFDVIATLTAAEVCTAVTLIVYVAVNELVVRPGHNRRRHQQSPPPPVVDTYDDNPDNPVA
jgi:membrane protein YdbS with pleckstrin-like domain